MAAGTLYTYPENFRAYKIQIAARYSGANLKVVSEAPAFKFGETNKTDDFLRKFPLGKVPAFESNCGLRLFESNAIAQFVSNDTLRGANTTDSALVQQWVNFADNEILPASCTWVFPCLGVIQFNKQATEHAKEDIKKALGLLNKHLETKTFLVGERVSLADITVGCNLLSLYKLVLDPEFRKPFPNVTRWFVTFVNQPEVKAVVGDVALCEKMAQFDNKKYQELHGGQKKEGKKDKPKQEQKKSEPKPKAKPKEDDEEDDVPKEKPSKDPFAALPVGSFVMDTWKKMYSNSDVKTEALPWFFENFDAENYSVWQAEYLYPEELSLIFMSANLVGGMFQRLDRLRKHAFGCVGVFGKDRDSTISGVWIWKGQDLAFTLSPDCQVDYESYKWTKLDWGSEETKKLITNYFLCEDGEYGGKTYADGKVFK